MAGKIPLYTGKDVEHLRRAGAANAAVLDFIRPFVRAGISTGELDRQIHDFTVSQGYIPACLGYKGYPKSACISVNEIVCHGIPDDRVLKDGDIVNIDVTTIVDGWFGDQSETMLVGTVSPAAQQLVQTTFDCLCAGIQAIVPFGTVYDIAVAITTLAESRGYSVVREYQGHGIGQKFHQRPGIPHYPMAESRRDIIAPGTCFTIEPMINEGTWETKLDRRDGWTVRTADGKLSAQFEHTILMTETGPEILTATRLGPRAGHRF